MTKMAVVSLQILLCTFLGEVNQAKVKLAMSRIIKNYDDDKGLQLFKPRDGGKGSSNDGNTARRVLEDEEYLSKQTGISVNLIHRLNIIRIALTCTKKKNAKKFQAYCTVTKEVYNKELPWYPAPPSLHKMFDHCDDFLKVFPSTLTTGMMSEEPGESANKDIKRFQIENAFQGDPERRNLDTFNRLIDRSNPKVLYFLVDKKLERRSSEELPQEVLDLLEDSD